MFFLKAAEEKEKIKPILEGNALIEAIKTLREKKGSENKKAFNELVKNFEPLINAKIAELVKSDRLRSLHIEHNEIKHTVLSLFAEVLLSKSPSGNYHLDLSLDPRQVAGYIKSAFATKINVDMVRKLLGKGEVVEDLNKVKYEINNALKKFEVKYKRKMDFSDFELEKSKILNADDPAFDDIEGDVKKLADILKISDVDEVKNMLAEYLNSTGKSLDQEVKGEEGKGDDNVQTLMDKLHTGEPIPDEVLKDKEIRQALMDAIKESFNAEEQKVITTYLFPSKADIQKAVEMFGNEKVKKELTSDQVAGLTGVSERKVRHYLSKYFRDKLIADPVLHDLYTASLIRSMVKFAMSTIEIRTPEDLIFDIVASNSTLKDELARIKQDALNSGVNIKDVSDFLVSDGVSSLTLKSKKEFQALPFPKRLQLAESI
jgi:hypothetical protein